MFGHNIIYSIILKEWWDMVYIEISVIDSSSYIKIILHRAYSSHPQQLCILNTMNNMGGYTCMLAILITIMAIVSILIYLLINYNIRFNTAVWNYTPPKIINILGFCSSKN